MHSNLWQRIVGARLSEILDMENQKARAPTIKMEQEKEVGLIEVLMKGTRIKQYPPEQDDVFFDAADTFLQILLLDLRP